MHIQQCVKNRIGLISITGTRRKRTNCRKSRTCPQKKRDEPTVVHERLTPWVPPVSESLGKPFRTLNQTNIYQSQGAREREEIDQLARAARGPGREEPSKEKVTDRTASLGGEIDRSRREL